MSKLHEIFQQKINITPEMEKKAKLIYDEIAELLEDKLSEYSPSIFSQGSFRLGTIIKPLKGDDYDLDFVCLLNINKEQITQNGLKKLVGAVLKSKYNETIIEEKKRCWRLNFPNFHVDILPAIPDSDIAGYDELEAEDFKKSPILIPDKELKMWQSSNPVGYVAWFDYRKKYTVHKNIAIIEAQEDLPKQNCDCTLQKVVKIMKYHRDRKFVNNLDNKPISIILTTLAAQHYNGEQDLVEALQGIVTRITSTSSIFDTNYIPNPSNPRENFADAWEKEPKKKEAFREWLYLLEKLAKEYVLANDDESKIDKVLFEHLGYAAPVPVISTPYSIGTINNPPKQWFRND